MRSARLFSLLLLQLALVRCMVEGASDGQTTATTMPEEELICFNGFIMDHRCIERGTLLDHSRLETLEHPHIHSIRCLVDNSDCRRSGYELLLDPPPKVDENGTVPQSNNNLHGRVFQLDAVGNQMVIGLARTVGTCSSCYGNGTQEAGLRATVLGYKRPAVDNKNDGQLVTPQLLQVVQVRSDNERCTEAEGGQYVPTVVSYESGSTFVVDPVMMHAALMIVAWGLLVPVAVLSGLFLRHQKTTWFDVHRVCNILALCLTGIGIVYAIAKFGSSFGEKGTESTRRHGILGMTTFACGFVQMIMGMCRPRIPTTQQEQQDSLPSSSEPEPEPQKTCKRRLFELVHRSLGYATLALAYTTMYFGAEASGNDRQAAFLGVWFTIFGFAVAVALWMLWGKHRHSRGYSTEEEDEEATDAHLPKAKQKSKSARTMQGSETSGDDKDVEEPEDEYFVGKSTKKKSAGGEMRKL